MNNAMSSPLGAMTWQIWRAQRWGFTVGVGYLVIAVIVAQFLPGALARSSLGIEALPDAGWNLTLPCFLILMHWLMTFSVTGSADFQEKGYTVYMLVLPISTRMLAIWPMLLGCASLAGLWLVIALGILRPTSNPAPIFWPMTALAVMLTMLQGVSWTPMVQSWLRMVVALPALVLPMAGVVFVQTFQISEWIATSAFLVMLPLTTWVCLRGVAMARRGDAIEWMMATRIAERIAAWRKPAERPFTSIGAAQFWYEFRLYGRMLPFVSLLVLPMFCPLAFLFHRDEIALFWKAIAMLVCMPMLFAATLSAQTGNVAFPFLATRPIHVTQVVSAKIKMALGSVLMSTAMVLLVVPIFLLRPAVLESMTSAMQAMGPLKSTFVVVAVILGPPILTWKLMVENFWLGLAGRPWFTNTCVLGTAILMGIATLAGIWIWTRPDLHEGLRAAVPWILVVLAGVKIGLGVWLVREVIWSKLVRTRTVLLLLGLWLLAFAGMSCFLTSQLAGLPIGVLSIVSAVVLGLPLNRIALAPLMFVWNRHR
jgi:hypothetical protein